MDAEINDSPSTLQQYLGFTTTRKRFESGHNFFTFPLLHSTPLNTIGPIIETTSTFVVERLTLIQFKTSYNGKSSPFIACLQLYPKHYVSLTDHYPIANVYQTRPQNPQPNPLKMSR